MPKNKIKIIVAGPTATGKSTLLWGFAKFLMDNGVDVDINSPDYKNINHLQMSMEHDITLQQRLNLLKEKMHVEFEEVNTNCEPNLREVSEVLNYKTNKK